MAVKEKVKSRDGNECQKCKFTGSKDRLEAHHIIPSCYGGSDSLDNMVTLCNKCHNAAPTNIVPYDISNQCNDVTELNVENHPELATHFENRFSDYVRTGQLPMYDLIMFGMEIRMGYEEYDMDTVDAFMHSIRQLSNGDDQITPRTYEGVWLMAAKMCGHLQDCQTIDNDVLAGDSGQLKFDF